MMQSYLLSSFFSLILSMIVSGLLCKSVSKKNSLILFGFFASVAIFSSLGRYAPTAFGKYSWCEELFEIAFSLIISKFLNISFEEIGLIIPSEIRKWLIALIIFVLSITYALIESIFFNGYKPHDAEAIFFQSTIPGINEELCFRGVGFALVSRAFGSGKDGIAKWIIPAMFTSFIFFTAHLGIEKFNYSSISIIIPVQIIIPIIFLVCVRVFTKSILPGVIIHNAINVIPIISGLFCSQGNIAWFVN